MKPIKKSELYTCPKCNAYFEVEQGEDEEMPGYRKRCETEFDEPTPPRYKLLKLVDGVWYVEGVYESPEQLAEAARYLGTLGYPQIKVKVV